MLYRIPARCLTVLVCLALLLLATDRLPLYAQETGVLAPSAQNNTVVLGNTQYMQDTTWTSDNTYVLDGVIIVSTGVTLTIQPGTAVKVAPEKLIRVDGTLVAQGTEAQPIVFTAKMADGSKWAGIYFTPSAGDAIFDNNGDYRSGSILQHVELSDAEAGLTLNGRAPWIADSIFRRTATVLTMGGIQPLRVERNQINGGRFYAAGAASVLQNTLSGSNVCGIGLSGGSPLIMQNTLLGCQIWGHGLVPAVISNTVSVGALELSNWSEVGGQAPLPSFLPQSKYTAVSTGYYHTCALTADGGVVCWGENRRGQLGNGTTTDRTIPMEVSGLASGAGAISAGDGHTCALTTSGGVKCWGWNGHGQLGDGTTTDRTTPIDVSGLASSVTAISAGYQHTCVVTTDGAAKCWGNNSSGQLGNGTTIYSTTPVEVSSLASGVAAISAGEHHTCALTTAGGVKCWGYNYYGELGDGTTTHSTVPVDVSGLTSGAVAVSVGNGHTCALTTSGGVKCWGRNGEGQLGDSTTTNHSTPVMVSGLMSGVAAISSGSNHTCALTTPGGAKCWGYNGYGKLGDGTYNSSSVPMDVIGLTAGVLAVSAGDMHTCAPIDSSDVKCWGHNQSGQLGNGTAQNWSAVPVDVANGVAFIQGNVVYGGYGMRVSAGDGETRVTRNRVVGTKDGLELSSNMTPLIVEYNTIVYNTDSGMSVQGNVPGDVLIAHNTISFNANSGLVFGSTKAPDDLIIQQNNLNGNGHYDLRLEHGTAGTQNFVLDASDNYWGVASEQVSTRIYDCTFDGNGCGNSASTLGKVAFDPPLIAPDQDAPIHVTVYLPAVQR